MEEKGGANNTRYVRAPQQQYYEYQWGNGTTKYYGYVHHICIERDQSIIRCLLLAKMIFFFNEILDLNS